MGLTRRIFPDHSNPRSSQSREQVPFDGEIFSPRKDWARDFRHLASGLLRASITSSEIPKRAPFLKLFNVRTSLFCCFQKRLLSTWKKKHRPLKNIYQDKLRGRYWIWVTSILRIVCDGSPSTGKGQYYKSAGRVVSEISWAWKGWGNWLALSKHDNENDFAVVLLINPCVIRCLDPTDWYQLMDSDLYFYSFQFSTLSPFQSW